MMSERTFTAAFEQDKDWWVAWCEEVPGAVTQGQTNEEAREHLQEAIRLVLDVRCELADEAARAGRVLVCQSVLAAV
jgi:predicted RNase H-like HicB family nuclease